MKPLKKLLIMALLALSLPSVVRAQNSPNSSIETDANLKDSTTHVVVERKVIETTKTYQQDTPRDVQRKIAIIVQNRASAALNDQVAVLEDLVSSRVAGKGFSVMSRDDVTRSMRDYSTGKDPNGELTALDRSLEDNSSALRLAQNLGADYILVPSILSLGTDKVAYNGNGISTVNIAHKLRVSYKIIEAGEGGAVRGGAFVSEKDIRQTEGVQTESSDILNDLMDDAAQQLADAIADNAKALPAQVAKAAMVNLTVACTMTDPRQQPILVSALGITPDNHVVVTNQPVVVEPMDVTVELDGVAIGSAPGTFQARPGLHKIRLSREGFDDWARTVNIYDGQTLRVALQMSNAGYARWADTTAFLAGLDKDRKLTDAEVKRIEGIAEFFKNSHYRVDTKENVHVTYKSLY
jgi:hypothetical protein